MGSVGIELKTAREKKNIALGEVAAATRISHTNLESLEEGRYKDLPGGVYNRAFIRAYCEFLGLEPKEILARYEEEITPPSDKTTRAKEKTKLPREPLIRPHPLAAWGFVLLISIVGLYFSRNWIAGVFSPYFAHSPATKMTPPRAPQQAPASKPQAPPVISQPEPSATVAPQFVGPVRPASVAANEAAAPGAGTTSAFPSRPPGKIRLEIQVIEQCWMSVNSDGSRAIVKIMEPGEHYIFDAEERFYLIIGNAGGIRLTINGKPAKSLGKSGEVIRTLINEQTMKDLVQNPAN